MGQPPELDVQPVVLEGRHARLEPLTPEHLDGIMAAGVAPEIWRWMPVHPKTRQEFEAWMADAFARRDAGDQLPMAIIDRASGELIGSTRLMAISPRDRRLEIGWTWLSPRVQRTPVNTECKYLLLAHCFETLGCLRVELKTDGRNMTSRNAILRIGATFEGIFRKHSLTQGGYQRDAVYFSFIDDEWPEVKRRLEEMLAR